MRRFAPAWRIAEEQALSQMPLVLAPFGTGRCLTLLNAFQATYRSLPMHTRKTVTPFKMITPLVYPKTSLLKILAFFIDRPSASLPSELSSLRSEEFIVPSLFFPIR